MSNQVELLEELSAAVATSVGHVVYVVDLDVLLHVVDFIELLRARVAL